MYSAFATGKMEQVSFLVDHGHHPSMKLTCCLDRDSDITMLAMSNSQERDQEDWEALLRAADARFRLEEVRRIPDAKLDLIIARWEGDA